MLPKKVILIKSPRNPMLYQRYDMYFISQLNERPEILILKWNYWIRTFKCVPLFSTTHISTKTMKIWFAANSRKKELNYHSQKQNGEHVLKWIIDWIIIKEQIYPVRYRKSCFTYGIASIKFRILLTILEGLSYSVQDF